MFPAGNKAKRLSSVNYSAKTIHHHHHTLKNNIYHSNKRKPPSPFFHSDTNPVLDHVLVYSDDKTHVLVVTVELIWLFLNIIFLIFVQTPNKSFRFTRFRRRYVNRNAVVLTIHCQSYTAFYRDVRCSKWPGSFFLTYFLLSTPVARMLLTPRLVSRRKKMK